MRPHVEALIQAAGQGTRLGGPKAFVELCGTTLLQRAVAVMLEVADRVVAGVPGDDIDRARSMSDPVRVEIVAGGARRLDTLRILLARSEAPWLILHDAVHPFVTADLTRDVLDAAHEHGAAIAGVPVARFLYDTDGRLRAAPNEVIQTQKPMAFRRADLVRGFELLDAGSGPEADHERGALELLALADVRPRFVRGHARNLKITHPEDLELARILVGADRPEVTGDLPTTTTRPR
jgi:2-C-methyl-D-erythritol 4-phosphate cytidylyltransferase